MREYLYSSYSTLFEVYVSTGKTTKRYHGVGAHLVLPKDRTYLIGIDQSTSQTGVCVQTYDNGKPLRIQMDITNKGLPDQTLYAIMLREFFKQIFEGLQLRLVVMEMPIAQANNVTARTKLERLKGFLDSLRFDIESFNKAEHISISPSGWRKHYLAAPEYAGRRQATDLVKLAAIEETIRRHPEFDDYDKLFNRNMDSFDAVGILEGAIPEYFYKGILGVKRWHTSMPNNVKRYVAHYEILPYTTESAEEFIQDVLQDYFEDPGEVTDTRGMSVWVVDDFGMGAAEAVQNIVSSTNTIALVVFKYKNPKHYLAFQWAENLVREENSTYCCVCWRENTTAKVNLEDRFASWIELPDLFAEELDKMEEQEGIFDI